MLDKERDGLLTAEMAFNEIIRDRHNKAAIVAELSSAVTNGTLTNYNAVVSTVIELLVNELNDESDFDIALRNLATAKTVCIKNNFQGK